MAKESNQSLTFASTEALLDELATRHAAIVCAMERPLKKDATSTEIAVYFTAHKSRHEDMLLMAGQLYTEIYADWLASKGEVVE